MEVHRGEVFYADLSPVVGSEQGGVRPVLIIQNDIGNRHSPTVIAAAITSRQDKNRLRWGCTTSQWPKAPIWTADIFENQISSSRMAFCTIMPLGVSRRVSPSSTA